MALYSLKMRAEKSAGKREHVSGAEKILQEEELPEHLAALLSRALHHAKGRADFVNFKVESIAPEAVEHLPALPVSTVEVETPAEGRRVIIDALGKLGLKNGEAILAKFSETYGMRGAMLLDADTLERLEPDAERGLRATYMDAERTAKGASDCKNHFAEAVVLATKVVHAPHIVAEICVSDDPDYVTGYVAAPSLGYRRITKLKEAGSPDGGRIFLYRGPRGGVAETIRYLEKQCVLVQGVPDSPAGGAHREDMAERLAAQLAAKKERNLCREMHEIDSAQAAHVTVGGAEKLLLASNNYLGLVDHPRLKRAAQEAVERYGCGSGGSRLTTGTLPLHTKLEEELAAFKGTEAALLFDTGYMANVGILSALGQKGTVFFSDELNHASIIDGCRLSRAKTVVYRHSDMKDLEEKLAAHAQCPGVIVSDAVFSMDGDIADLPRILELARKYHVWSMVDEAHSTGVIGGTGRGICEHFHLREKPDVLMGTLSKALASEGGYVCGSRLLIDYLKNTARSFIFSTSQSPANLAAASAALQLLQEEPERCARLQENVRVFCAALAENGVEVRSETAIVPLIIGEESLAVKIAKDLERQGILVSAIRYPTVAKGAARLRVALAATHTEEELKRAAAHIAACIESFHGTA
ncbi:8-amino-7-oxononanoate synthase [Selenomonas sp. CM52]|uniref:8-amino-7-oxononanoate synthase n=1 Tax=Selenomonas sp. CM52 TaxID=936381 RepID=UPI00027C5F33|nr:8-amino-7-oxononanoate synthase [Selenomonas sp. CM52]EJU26442.1 6-carboxyhexanoate--CoA ligase / 8-amino-7-oxononanoate synthase multi-domain protein [Selenomonas sp. CM52]